MRRKAVKKWLVLYNKTMSVCVGLYRDGLLCTLLLAVYRPSGSFHQPTGAGFGRNGSDDDGHVVRKVGGK